MKEQRVFLREREKREEKGLTFLFLREIYPKRGGRDIQNHEQKPQKNKKSQNLFLQKKKQTEQRRGDIFCLR